MKDFTYYDPVTGLIVGHFSSSSDESAALNVTTERPAVPGRHDRTTKRVDPQTLQVIDHAHEASSLERIHSVYARIAALESKQPRAVREAVLLGTEQAIGRLKSLDAQIAILRTELV